MDRRELLAAAAAPLALARRSAPPSPGAAVGPRSRSSPPTSRRAIVAVDLSNGEIHARLKTPAGPRSIESIGERAALVAHTEGGRLTLVDSRLRVRPIVGDFGAPRYTAVSPGRRLAYVTDSERQEVVVVELDGRRVIGRTPVGGPARHLGIDRAGSRLWVALGSKAHAIAVLSLAEPRRPRVVGTVRPPFLAHDVGFTPGGRRVWVTSGDRGRIAIYDARTGRARPHDRG